MKICELHLGPLSSAPKQTANLNSNLKSRFIADFLTNDTVLYTMHVRLVCHFIFYVMYKASKLCPCMFKATNVRIGNTLFQSHYQIC